MFDFHKPAALAAFCDTPANVHEAVLLHFHQYVLSHPDFLSEDAQHWKLSLATPEVSAGRVTTDYSVMITENTPSQPVRTVSLRCAQIARGGLHPYLSVNFFEGTLAARPEAGARERAAKRLAHCLFSRKLQAKEVPMALERVQKTAQLIGHHALAFMNREPIGKLHVVEGFAPFRL